MKVSISNIAWDAAEDGHVAALLNEFRIKGLELAPTKIWDAPAEAEATAVNRYRDYWARRGVEIVAFQSLLFGRPELTIFDTAEARENTVAYLTSIIGLAGSLGAKVLVFGSPKNRIVGTLSPARAMEVAVNFFSRLGEVAADHGVRFCIEPNPATYGCDFVRTAAEGLELVRRVNHPGFGLHLDSGALTLNGEDYERALETCFDWLTHFHISEPNLGLVGQSQTDHRRIARALSRLGYGNWVSIEMRNNLTNPNPGAVRSALDFVTSTYC